MTRFMTSKTSYFPIVGCSATAHADAAEFESRWFLIDEAGQWVGAGAQAKLAGVSINVMHGYLVLRAAGMLRLDVPIEVIEDDDSVRLKVTVAGQSADVIDEGDLAAAWFSNVMGSSCRLVKVHPDETTPTFG
jgi:uncharacterized protein YcbX